MAEMRFEQAKRALLAANYQVLGVKGEDLHMVFWPPERDNSRKTQAMNTSQLLALAETLPSPDEEKTPVVDLRRVGIVARLRKAPMVTDAEGVPTVNILLQISGKSAVNSLPIDMIRDLLGQDVLIQINALQIRFELEGKTGGGR